MLLAIACAPVMAADPSIDEMIDALSTKPAAPLTRGIQKGPMPSAKREGRLQLSVQFEFGSAAITPASRELLLKLANAMKSPALAGNRFRIEGHTDIVGGAAANLVLSQRRALAVKQFLAAESGVDGNRMASWGMGSTTLANTVDPAAAENRRVVIVSLEPLPSGAAFDSSAGSVMQVKGTLNVRRKDEAIALHAGARIQQGDVLVTPEGSTALVRMDDGANLLLRSETDLKIVKLQLQGEAGVLSQAFELLSGGCRYVTGALGKSRPTAVAFSTGTATVGIRGTDFDIVYTTRAQGTQESGTYVRVLKGAVSLGGLDGSSVQIAKDEQAFAGTPKPVTRGAPRVPAATRIRDAAGIFKTGELDELLEAR